MQGDDDFDRVWLFVCLFVCVSSPVLLFSRSKVQVKGKGQMFVFGALEFVA